MILFLSQYHTVSTTVDLKSESMIPPAFFFFLKVVLAIQHLLCFLTNFRIICSSSLKTLTDLLIEIV